MRRRLPFIVAGSYAAVYLAVLLKNVIWSVGDQTDVIRTGMAAFPLGLVASLTFPGGRNGAFIAVSVCAAVNVVVLFLLTRWFASHSTMVDSKKPS
jgi:hypothetical protein